MKKGIKRIVTFILVVVCLFAFSSSSVSAKAKYGGADKYSFYWRADRKMYGLKVGVDNYTGEARYNFKSWIVNLQNMSGTKYWDNYKNARKTAQSVEIGVSKNRTASSTKSYTVSGQVGLPVPKNASIVSGKIGGSYTNSKTYSKTVGTSSAYTINTNSKNGYYAVVHAVNADEYTVRLKKNGYSCSSGKMLRYQTTNGYERLRYSSKAF